MHAHVPKHGACWRGCIASITTGGDAARGLRGRRSAQLPDRADLEPILDEAVDYSKSPIDDCGYHEGDGNNKTDRDYNNK